MKIGLYCAVVLGSTIPGTVVRRIGSGTFLTTRTTTSVFVLSVPPPRRFAASRRVDLIALGKETRFLLLDAPNLAHQLTKKPGFSQFGLVLWLCVDCLVPWLCLGIAVLRLRRPLRSLHGKVKLKADRSTQPFQGGNLTSIFSRRRVRYCFCSQTGPQASNPTHH
jgi:hypothetical protein